MLKMFPSIPTLKQVFIIKEWILSVFKIIYWSDYIIFYLFCYVVNNYIIF